MARAFIGVGSNIDPGANIPQALRLLHRQLPIKAISTFYATPAEGRPEQPDFFNGVAEVAIDLAPLALKDLLRGIEAQLGRVRTTDKYAPRTIDLDLLLYDDLVLNHTDLVLPDPLIERRAFLAVPLAELALDLLLPGSRRRIAEIAADLGYNNLVILTDFTESLKKEIAR